MIPDVVAFSVALSANYLFKVPTFMFLTLHSGSLCPEFIWLSCKFAIVALLEMVYPSLLTILYLSLDSHWPPLVLASIEYTNTTVCLYSLLGSSHSMVLLGLLGIH